MIVLRSSTLTCTSSHALLEDWSKWLLVEKLPYVRSFEVFLRRRACTRRTTAPTGHASLSCPLTLHLKKKSKKRRKVPSLEGTKLKFVTGPRLAHDHGENRAQKEDSMAEPENRPPPLQA